MAAKKKDTSDKAKKPSLDIFDEMAALDRKKINWLESQDPDLAKTFSPLVAMRWFSAVGDHSGLADYHILMANELVNIGFWDLSKHPELQWKLMAAAGSGQTQRHNWIPGSKKKNTNKLDNVILGLYPSLNDTELALFKAKLTKDSLKDMLKDMGMPDADIKPIMDDFKKLSDGK